MKKSYITSPVYYVNDIAHIGHAYTTIICDMLKRYHKLHGIDCIFTTGTDEHGQKIQQSAQKNNISPIEYANRVSAQFRALWKDFYISIDNFIRTTDEKNCNAAKIAFAKMFAKGDIYKGEYEGYYCVSCESQFANVSEERCPDCGKRVQTIKEESYFFSLSKYQQKLLDWYEECPDVIHPRHKKNEIINFVKGGLKDLSITRTSFNWGVALPDSIAKNDDKKHIMYVWLDALMSYLSAIDFGVGIDCENIGAQKSVEEIAGVHFKMDYWQHAIHIVGKDILRFHAIYWPAFLMSLDLPLPKKIYAHGWWLNEGQKMSKSIGNVINPREMVQKFGMDAFRYFLIREVPFGQDGDFTKNAVIERINSDLANDIGNLLNRLIAMSEKYFSLKLEASLDSDFTTQKEELCAILSSFEKKMENLELHLALETLCGIFALGNAMISKYEPWKLIKEDEKKTKSLLILIANILAKGALTLSAFMPTSAQRIAKALGIQINAKNYKDLILESKFLNRFNISKVPPLFPKIEKPKTNIQDTNNKTESKNTDSKQDIGEETSKFINVKDFEKLDLRVGEVLSCQRVKGSEKLLLLKIDIGDERPRQILSGIAKFYKPNELVGKQVCVITNLKPAKLMGILSEGMILSASDEDGLSLLGVDIKKINGAKIS